MVIKELALANKVVYKDWFPVIFVPLDLLTRPYTILVSTLQRGIKQEIYKDKIF